MSKSSYEQIGDSVTNNYEQIGDSVTNNYTGVN